MTPPPTHCRIRGVVEEEEKVSNSVDKLTLLHTAVICCTQVTLHLQSQPTRAILYTYYHLFKRRYIVYILYGFYGVAWRRICFSLWSLSTVSIDLFCFDLGHLHFHYLSTTTFLIPPISLPYSSDHLISPLATFNLFSCSVYMSVGVHTPRPYFLTSNDNAHNTHLHLLISHPLPTIDTTRHNNAEPPNLPISTFPPPKKNKKSKKDDRHMTLPAPPQKLKPQK